MSIPDNLLLGGLVTLFSKVFNFDSWFADDINTLAKEIPLDLGGSKIKTKYKDLCLNLLSQLNKM